MLNFELDDLSRKELGDLHFECMTNLKMFSKVFMPERFSGPFTTLHDRIVELIESPARKVAIAAPRGLGKTSLCIARSAQQILYRNIHYLPYVSKSFSSAQLQTENLKRELLMNRDIRKFFGSIKQKGSAGFGMDESFAKVSWVAQLDPELDPTLIMPRGSGQQIRGVLFMHYRPDLFVVDDFEDPLTITNDELRKAWKDWFKADLVKAVSRLDKHWKIIYIDTLKHEDSLLQDLLDASDWESERLELCDDELKSNVPGWYTDAEIKEEHESHEESGQLDIFMREYRNLPVAEETKSFKSKYFKHYEEKDLPKLVSGSVSALRNVILVDPAKTATMQSADSAIVCCGVDQANRAIYVRDIVSGKFYPDELYKEMFEMLVRFNSHVLGVEVTSLNEFIKQPVKNYGRTIGINPIYKWLHARKSKEERIAALVPYYRSGWIYHNRSCCTKLEQQLGGFPRSKLWDVMDCLAYIVEVMEMDEFYFEPEEWPEFGEDETLYNELENEKPVNDWRQY
jgi:hypothetical protein